MKLAEVIADLDASAFDVSFTGFDAEEVDALMNDFILPRRSEDDFDPEEAAAEIAGGRWACTQPGDLWQLGRHRLLCGDAASVEDMERLCGGERAACSFAAPASISLADYGKMGWPRGWKGWGLRLTTSAAMRRLSAGNIDDLFTTGSQYVEPIGFIA